MKTKWKILLSFAAGILVAVTIPVLLLAFGAFNVGADVAPGAVERTLASWAVDRSVETRAPKTQNIFVSQPGAVAVGFEHYRANCVICHGAPGLEGSELSKGLNPSPPSLTEILENVSEGEVFWIVKHGIRMTGMPAFGPTHTDEEIWYLVAFIRRLSALTASEQEALKTAVGKEAHHHHESHAPTSEENAHSAGSSPHD